VETGQLLSPFYYNEQRVGIGPALEQSVVNLGDSTFFVGPDDVYIYDLTDLKPIGGNIRKSLIESIDPQYIDRCFALFIEETDEVWLFVVSKGSQYPNLAWVYNTLYNSWTWFELAFPNDFIRAGGYFRQQQGVQWNQQAGTWAQQTQTWESLIPVALSSDVLLGTINGNVHEGIVGEVQDSGAAIKAVWTSKGFDLENPDLLKTLVRVKIGYIVTDATALLCEWSVDGMNTWNGLTSVPLVSLPQLVGGAESGLAESGLAPSGAPSTLPNPQTQELFTYYDVIVTGSRIHFRVRHETGEGLPEITEFIPTFVLRGEAVEGQTV